MSNAKMDSPVGNPLPSKSTDSIGLPSPKGGGTPVKLETPVGGFSSKFGSVDLNFSNPLNSPLDLPRDGKAGLQSPLTGNITGKKV